jgi:hypothetical protein
MFPGVSPLAMMFDPFGVVPEYPKGVCPIIAQRESLGQMMTLRRNIPYTRSMVTCRAFSSVTWKGWAMR